MATKRKPMAKPRQKESPCHEGDPSKKSRKVRKTGQSEKGSEEGAAPASIAKENQSDGEDRRQSELRYHRDVGHDDRDVGHDDPFALQSDPIAAVLGLPIHVLHARE